MPVFLFSLSSPPLSLPPSLDPLSLPLSPKGPAQFLYLTKPSNQWLVSIQSRASAALAACSSVPVPC